MRRKVDKGVWLLYEFKTKNNKMSTIIAAFESDDSLIDYCKQNKINLEYNALEKYNHSYLNIEFWEDTKM